MGNPVTVQELREFLERLLANEGKQMQAGGWWRSPLLACGAVDGRFEILPKVAFREHLLPRDLLATARTVIVFFIPYKKDLLKENKKGDRPCQLGTLCRTNNLVSRVSKLLEGPCSHNMGPVSSPAHNFDGSTHSALVHNISGHWWARAVWYHHTDYTGRGRFKPCDPKPNSGTIPGRNPELVSNGKNEGAGMPAPPSGAILTKPMLERLEADVPLIHSSS
jgi:hypothetical protein